MSIDKEVKIIKITWSDSYGCTSAWEPKTDISTLLICNSVGFLINETNEIIVLANSIANETDRTIEQVNGIMVIPKKSIIERHEI